MSPVLVMYIDAVLCRQYTSNTGSTGCNCSSVYNHSCPGGTTYQCSPSRHGTLRRVQYLPGTLPLVTAACARCAGTEIAARTLAMRRSLYSHGVPLSPQRCHIPPAAPSPPLPSFCPFLFPQPHMNVRFVSLYTKHWYSRHGSACAGGIN